MLLGPIFRRELDVAAKRWGTFGDRCSVPCVVLLVIATAAVGSGLLGWGGAAVGVEQRGQHGGAQAGGGAAEEVAAGEQ